VNIATSCGIRITPLPSQARYASQFNLTDLLCLGL